VRWALDSIPESRGGLRIAVDNDAQMMEALELIRRTGPAAIEVLDRTFLKFVAESLSASTRQLAIRASAILLVEYEGGPAAVQRTLSAVRARLGTIAYEALLGVRAHRARLAVGHTARGQSAARAPRGIAAARSRSLRTAACRSIAWPTISRCFVRFRRVTGSRW
jgi:hypothetical protein